MPFLVYMLTLSVCLSIVEQDSVNADSPPTYPEKCRIVRGKQFVGFGYVYRTGEAKSLDDCMQACVTDQPTCKSGHWFGDTSQCHLKKVSAGNQTELLTEPAQGDETMVYFEPCLDSGATTPTLIYG